MGRQPIAPPQRPIQRQQSEPIVSQGIEMIDLCCKWNSAFCYRRKLGYQIELLMSQLMELFQPVYSATIKFMLKIGLIKEIIKKVKEGKNENSNQS